MRWVIWSFAAFFYFYEYILRVSPSTMVPELMSSFQIGAGGIGVLGGSFFFAYAPMQLPVGILMDRFGARKLLTYASLGCGIGAILFALAKGLTLAYIGRLLIGAAASFAFVAMVYVCSHWFEKSKRALLVGLANSIAMLGGLVGEGPLSTTVHAIGWRWSMLILGFVGLLLALFIFFTIFKKEQDTLDLKKTTTQNEHKYTFFEGFKVLLFSRQNWLNSIIALLFYATTSALTGLWGIAFIQQAYGVSKIIAGYAISMVFLGWLVGGPFFGFISDRLANRKRIVSFCIFCTLAAILPVIYWTQIPVPFLYILIFSAGFFSSGQLLNFTFSTEINPKEIKGTAIAFTNFIVAVGGAFILPLIGGILDFVNPQKESLHDAYSAQAFKFALTLLPLFLLIAWLLTFFLNEKERNQHEPS